MARDAAHVRDLADGRFVVRVGHELVGVARDGKHVGLFQRGDRASDGTRRVRPTRLARWSIYFPSLIGAGVLPNSVPLAVRCVRGVAPPQGPHYTIAAGTVHDNWTGLTWLQTASSSSMDPSTIGSYCASQTSNGGGWRAPSVNELETLWGDFSAPDSVGLDPNAFPAIAPAVGDEKLGSLDDVSGNADAGIPTAWYYVVNVAATGTTEDTMPPPGPSPSPTRAFYIVSAAGSDDGRRSPCSDFVRSTRKKAGGDTRVFLRGVSALTPTRRFVLSRLPLARRAPSVCASGPPRGHRRHGKRRLSLEVLALCETDVERQPERTAHLVQRLQARVHVRVFELRDLLLTDARELAELLLRQPGVLPCPTDHERGRERGAHGYSQESLPWRRVRSDHGSRRDLPVDQVRLKPTVQGVVQCVPDSPRRLLGEGLAPGAIRKLGKGLLAFGREKDFVVHGASSM